MLRIFRYGAFSLSAAQIARFSHSLYQEVFRRFGGPMSYSQYVNPATVGAAMASLDIHRTSELAVLQEKLSSNIRLFDSVFVTEHAGSGLPIRVIPLDSPDMAIGVSEGVFKRGYYTSMRAARVM
jgi:7-keto-8-aminopelargonate synthetase-like enzyme